ncbi:MAG: hypothetical protein C4287_13685 [Leptolyngbya sp. ERB_1_2]
MEDQAMQTTLTVRVLLLFAAVGAVALGIPVHSEAAHSQSVIYTDSWGRLPFRVTLKAEQ